MKILCVSDENAPTLENSANLRRRYSDIDLIISCGDMSVAYLDFIVTVLGKPLMYVRGNHDERYTETPPGGVNLHENFVNFKGVSIIGLEGCLKYNNGKIQYTQTEMHTKVISLAPRLRFRRWRKGHGVDILVTHTPPRGIHDIEDDFPHRGFDALIKFMDWYRPRYLIHGHVHTWDRRKQTDTQYKETRILNIMPYTVLEVDALENS
ncbi:MAG: metallophosphoesterase family protein [Anaerolineae bacterium]|nr:metallophosphoesterase family protein [Anaerolineae bacterium]